MKQLNFGATINKVILPARDLRLRWRGLIRSLKRPTHRSTFDTVFHCCVQKTASRWLMNLLADPLTYDASGLTLYPYPPLPERVPVRAEQRSWPHIPPRKIISPLYFSYHDYLQIPNNGRSRAFFVCRDPRDIVVSFYFSTKLSHRLNEKIVVRRAELSSVTEEQGIIKCVDYLKSDGVFDYLRSWAGQSDTDVRVFRFEDLTGESQMSWLRQMFDFLDFSFDDDSLEVLANKHSFERISGRARGREDVKSHYRSGVSGDWKKYFSAEVRDYFEAQEPRLVQVLGYS